MPAGTPTRRPPMLWPASPTCPAAASWTADGGQFRQLQAIGNWRGRTDGRHARLRLRASGLIGMKESELGFRILLCYANLAHAQWNLLHPIRRRPSAIARGRRGSQEPAETRLAGTYCPSQRRGSGHLGDHDRDRQVQDLRVALARAVHARGCRRPASRQVPSARQGAGPARSCRRDRAPDAATAAV